MVLRRVIDLVVHSEHHGQVFIFCGRRDDDLFDASA